MIAFLSLPDVGLTRTSITNIEKGRQKVLLHQVYDIARALGTTPTSILPVEMVSEPIAEIDRKLASSESVKGSSEADLDWMKRVAQFRSKSTQ